jgi:hypothetical protein
MRRPTGRLRTRWFRRRNWSWRVGFVRHEWWIGARYDFAADVWMVGLFGAVLVVAHG